MTVGSLFAGIGGFDEGLENVGMEIKWQVEINEFRLRVLKKDWPGIFRLTDITKIGVDDLEWVDVITGGFPCQDISTANRFAKGIDGIRSSLWFEFHRTIRLLRPRFIIVENVPALLFRGMGTVLTNLSEIGYDAEWQTISCAAIGADHIRKRTFILGYPEGTRRQRILRGELPVIDAAFFSHRPLDPPGRKIQEIEERMGQPAVFRSPNGLPIAKDRLSALGDSVMPQIVELIGKAILQADNE